MTFESNMKVLTTNIAHAFNAIVSRRLGIAVNAEASVKTNIQSSAQLAIAGLHQGMHRHRNG